MKKVVYAGKKERKKETLKIVLDWSAAQLNTSGSS